MDTMLPTRPDQKPVLPCYGYGATSDGFDYEEPLPFDKRRDIKSIPRDGRPGDVVAPGEEITPFDRPGDMNMTPRNRFPG
jgi:hypothetical protein